MAEVFRLLLVCWMLVWPGMAQIRHPLPVLWMRPWRDNLSVSLAPAVQLALQHLKTEAPPLGNYEIQLQLLDSQCDPAEALKTLFDAMWAGPNYLLLFGEVCPSLTALIARSLPALNLLQVAFAALSPSLSNRKWYGNLFSTVPSDRSLNQATVKLLQRYKWTRVGIISQEGARLTEMKKDLSRQLVKANIRVVSSESLLEDVCSSVRRLKESDVRIIIGLFEEESASQVFCCAYRLNLFGARYQWLVVDGGAAGWKLRGQQSGCTVESLQTATDGSIRLQTRVLSNSNIPGVSGQTPQDYQASYLKQLIQSRSKASPLHPFAYDAVWVAARALSQVMEAVKHRQKYSSQRNMSMGEEEVQMALLEAVKQTHFEGVTGPVFFRNGERMTSIDLIQFQGSSGVLVGDFNTSSQQLRLINHLMKFKGPAPARDRTLVLVQRQQVTLLLSSAVLSAAAVTIFITLTLLFFSVVSRKHWLLVWSPGPQDELLLLSIMLSSCSVLVSGLNGASLSHWTSELLCSVRLWTLCVGHTVAVAVLFTKTWRVYSLSNLTQKPAGCVLLLMLLMDMFVLIPWQVLDPLKWVVLQHQPQSDSAGEDVVIHLYSECCSSTNMELWITLVCGYKAPLLGLSCFVAWSVGILQVDHHLTLSMFAVTVFSVSGLSGSLLMSQNPPLQLCVTSILILCCNIFTLSCWLFGKKLCLNGSELQPTELQGDEEEKKTLSLLNQQLRNLTAQLNKEIETITEELCETSGLKSHQATRGRDQGRRSVAWSLATQVCSEDRSPERKPLSPEAINSPEHVWRRLSVQLPILHHSYLPAIGGVGTSSSSLFGSQDAFLHHNHHSCSPDAN